MCISLPGKIVRVEGNNAIVSYGEFGESEVQNLISAGVGEYVIVAQRMVVQKVSEEDALCVLNGL
ncbi:MAG: HypC/HybG/HupF family hydrogenase formation chaperone [Nanoarchaeota archaeon]|nr:HypC/HybG/HupF family hydrogenase formation chaperone [Nanoarchaeota archaeon]